MRFFFAILVTGLTLLATARAQSELLELEAVLPACSLKCMAEFIPKSACNITDIPCICTNVPLNDNIALCSSESCTVKELLTTKNVSMTMCGVAPRDRTHQVSYIGVGGGIVALVAFLLRLGSRVNEGALGMDDGIMCILMALAAPPTVFSVFLARDGLGKDIWTIPFDRLTRLLFFYFLGESFYLVAISVNKLVILLLIYRVFGIGEFKKYIFMVSAACAAYGVAFLFATIFQCSPVSYTWHSWDGEHKGHCNNINVQSYFSAGLNILLDVSVIILPMPKLWGLKMSWKKKISVMILFSLGTLVTIVSVVRLRSLLEFAKSTNFTWDYVPAAYMSTIELHVGIVCACLPAIRSLLVRIFPRIIGSIYELSTHRSFTSRSLTSKSGGTTSNTKGLYSTTDEEVFGSKAKLSFIPLTDVESQSHKGHVQAQSVDTHGGHPVNQL